MMNKLLRGKYSFFWFACLLAFCVFFVFFNDLVLHLNSRLFCPTGDGLQAYYTAIYHVKHDASFWHFEGLNYPYGEQVFFTGCQPLLTNVIKLLKPVVDLSPYLLGILNFFMLFSTVFCAGFLALILKHFNLPKILALALGISLAFLSPQIDRMGGHLSLTYTFVLPMYLFYVLRYADEFKLKHSIILALIAFIFAGTHLYFLVFFYFIGFSFHAFLYFQKKITLKKQLLHLFIQLLLPLILFQSIQWSIDTVSDRPSSPWGFMNFNANFSGVLTTPNRFYSFIFKPFPLSYPDWEGIAYVGLMGVVGFGVAVFLYLKNAIRLKIAHLFAITDDWKLNAFLLAAFSALFFSFAYPFSFFGGEEFLQYFGPIKQFRGVGRFAWLFFYVINLFIFVFLFKKIQHLPRIYVYLIFIGVYSFVTYDAYVFIKPKHDMFNQSRKQFSEGYYQDLDKWHFDKSHYQAIIPLPYFHNGSENVWIEPLSEIKEEVYPFALHSGLPVTGVNLSRTSLSQTYANFKLILEPSGKLQLLEKCSNKPFLIAAIPADLSEREQKFLSYASYLTSYKGLSFYSITPQRLNKLSNIRKDETQILAEKENKVPINGFLCSDSLGFVYFESFDRSSSLVPDFSDNRHSIKEIRIISEQKCPKLSSDTSLIFSFWVKNFTQDLVPRTTIEITFLDKKKKVVSAEYKLISQSLVQLKNDEALIEFECKMPLGCSDFRISTWNDYIFDAKVKLQLDNLLIRNKNNQVYKKIDSKRFFYNNRIF